MTPLADPPGRVAIFITSEFSTVSLFFQYFLLRSFYASRAVVALSDRRKSGLPQQPETRVETGPEFFIWIRCNPLKSRDSTKEIQGNASLFAWFSLDFLASDSP
jgi:hypothetical protein